MGFHQDNKLKSGVHVNRLISALFITIKRIAIIWHLLDEETMKIMVQALVLSKLDYGNSLLMGMTDYNLDMLQKIQNMACRIIFKLRTYDHVSDHLGQLHWLKVRIVSSIKHWCWFSNTNKICHHHICMNCWTTHITITLDQDQNNYQQWSWTLPL